MVFANIIKSEFVAKIVLEVKYMHTEKEIITVRNVAEASFVNTKNENTTVINAVVVHCVNRHGVKLKAKYERYCTPYLFCEQP